MRSLCPVNFNEIKKSCIGDSIYFMYTNRISKYYDKPLYYTLSYLRENKRMLVSSIYNLAEFKYRAKRYCYA